MNPRIQELIRLSAVPADQAKDYALAEGLVEPTERLDVAKFAELIVRECIQVAVNKDSGYVHPANVAGYMAAGRLTAAQMIREHFGVES